MRPLLCCAALLLPLAAPANAQEVRLSAGLGATWSSTLVTDQIVNPIDVNPGLSPTLVLGASIPAGERIRLGLQGSLSTGSLTAEEEGTGGTDLGSLRTAEILLAASGPAMVRQVYWQAGLGLLKYLPSEKQGLFLQGGPTRLLGSVGAEYRYPWKPEMDLTISARYTYHRFTTAELERRGFSRTQDVHRIALTVGIAR